jgi:hypothetical protein
MSKCLTAVAFVLLVLTGAMGLRNIVATHAATSAGPTLLAQGAPFPPTGPGGPAGGGH